MVGCEINYGGHKKAETIVDLSDMQDHGHKNSV